MKMHEENGIVYYDEPYRVNYLDFLYQHLDCDAIIKRDDAGTYENVQIVAYSVAKEKNELLWRIFREKYTGSDYVIGSHISKERINAIF